MKKEINELINLLFEVKRLIGEKIKEPKGEKCISIVQIKTLLFIKDQEPTMKEVSDYLGITPPSATSLVNLFAKSGFIKRVYDKSDRRVVRLQITEKGDKFLEGCFNNFAKKMGKAISVLNKRQINNLKEVLEVLSKK